MQQRAVANLWRDRQGACSRSNACPAHLGRSLWTPRAVEVQPILHTARRSIFRA